MPVVTLSGSIPAVRHFRDRIRPNFPRNSAGISAIHTYAFRRVMLYADAVSRNTQFTFGMPRCRNLCIRPKVFIQPKHSSTRFRFRWLTLYPSVSVVRPSMAPRDVLAATRGDTKLPTTDDQLASVRRPPTAYMSSKSTSISSRDWSTIFLILRMGCSCGIRLSRSM